jgi:DNA-binding transcriptional LysR family regulator
MMHSLHNLEAFVAVADSRSFVAAGRQLGVSASAVGKTLTRLEHKLGVRLLHRSTRSITLTAEGHLLLQRCRRILAEIKDAELELSQASSAPRGRLRISLPLVSSLLLPILGQFMHTYPEITLDLDFSDRIVDVIEEGFDAVVRTGHPSDSRLCARHLGNFQMLLVASPSYLARYGTPKVPSDLLQHRCLHYRFPNTGKLESWALTAPPDAAEWTLPISMICNNLETRVCFARQGLGIAYLPDFAVREFLANGQLRPLLQTELKHTGVFYVLWPASKYLSPKVRVLIDYLCQHLFIDPKA